MLNRGDDIPGIMRTVGDFTKMCIRDRLDAAWGKVQKRHGMMRASVEEDGTQSIAPSSKIGHIERAECANSSEAKQKLEEIKRTVFRCV